jgi:hypothetical protein
MLMIIIIEAPEGGWGGDWFGRALRAGQATGSIRPQNNNKSITKKNTNSSVQNTSRHHDNVNKQLGDYSLETLKALKCRNYKKK